MFDIKARGKSAEIFIYEDIGDDYFGGISGNAFAKELRDLGNVENIDVRLNSMGGSVFEGLTIYNLLRDNPARVNTHIDGMAASIASVIAMAGDTVSIAENAFMMIHKPWAPKMGDADEHRALADQLDKVESSIANAYTRHSQESPESIQEKMQAETWFDAQEALAFGLATEIRADTQAIAARGDFSKFPYKHVPQRFVARENPHAGEFAHMQQALRGLKI